MVLSSIPQIKHTSSDNFFLLSGPCAIEGEAMALRIAETIVGITDRLKIPYVFKGSFKKANRSRVDSFTDLVVAAAETGKTVNLKKGQFMSPESMKHAVGKVLDSGNQQVVITDRGTMFGYQDLIVDFRGIPVMKQFAPVVLDVTHSLQQPNQASGVTGGRPELIDTIARAGIAAGVDGIFLETHFDPATARSDGANMLPLDQLEGLLSRLTALRETVNRF